MCVCVAGRRNMTSADPKRQLPQCKIRRNYSCSICNYFTQNPRTFLHHQRDAHGEKVNIYECPSCLYASRHFQKLLRHTKMVHNGGVIAERRPRGKKRRREEAQLQSNQQDSHESDVEPSSDKTGAALRCSVCSFTTRIQSQLSRHERQEHIRTKFFRCTKCSYVTHIKARFTKHVKYHSMPMIKCNLCDFRTPYKWNLDRHYKNHNGHGAFRCSACNFTADIKQSLTVHEMNHHVPPVGQAAGLGVGRRRNKVGASDATAAEEALAHAAATVSAAAAAAAATIADQRREDLGQVAAAASVTASHKPKASAKKAKAHDAHNFQADFIHPDDIIHHSNGNIYIKNKCKLCNFKSAWDTEMARHEQRAHAAPSLTQRPALVTKKVPRPIPNLIPIQARPPALSQKDINDICAKSANSSLRDFASLIGAEEMFNVITESEVEDSKPLAEPVTSTPLVDGAIAKAPNMNFKKKNASFFDRLKEKLMTDAGETLNLTCKWCGHESKCLSELAGHQKTCGKEQVSAQSTPNLAHTSSTRCQHCRQRCKSSADLLQHLRICKQAIQECTEYEEPDVTIKLEEALVQDDFQEPHPMENVVFVWNKISSGMDQDDHNDRVENSTDILIHLESPESENSYPEPEVIPHTPTKMPTHGNDLDLVTEGKRVFKCPHCSFWASTASRFHVHIVGHLNKKPFECSLCAYRSNWRWDITKHIRLKSVRDPEHERAKVLMTDETGRRNYSKYNKYLTQLRVDSDSTSGRKPKSTYEMNQGRVSPNISSELPKLVKAPSSADFGTSLRNTPLRPPPPLKSPDGTYYHNFGSQKKKLGTDNKKTMFKCKKCNFRDPSRENILLHVKGHYRQEQQNSSGADMESDEASVSRGQAPFRCGHCHQVSNWKHVIQRHCRLKHSGDVRVVIGGKNGSSDKLEVDDQADEPDHVDIVQNGAFKCKNCPYSTNVESEFETHMCMHVQRSDSVLKCYFCPYYVVQKFDLYDHLKLHGVQNPEDYVSRAMLGKTEQQNDSSCKKYRCIACPYVSNSKSQFLYHKQFHRPRGAPFKCEYCSYNVTRRHLLHQHLRVHGIVIPPQKMPYNFKDSDGLDMEEYPGEEFEEVLLQNDLNMLLETQLLPDIPLVWVSKHGKFTKMFKCRYCPHVNLRKVNIQDHEKMHGTRNLSSMKNGEVEHHCQECNYMCNNAGVLSSHAKVHQGMYGQIHCLVDSTKGDEEQILELCKLLNGTLQDSETESVLENSMQSEATSDVDCMEEQDCITVEVNDQYELDRVLFFCEHCPARFLNEKELLIHNRFHGIRLFYKCEYCTYTARQKPHLLSHNKVHSDEYQEKTKILQSEYTTSPDYGCPRTAVIVDGNDNIWVVISGISKAVNGEDKVQNTSAPKVSNKNFACLKCPARFFKNELLQYHMTLHGCNNPYKCKMCDYAARTSSNLQKHEKIHEQPSNAMDNEVNSQMLINDIPISGTDLFHQKSEMAKQNIDKYYQSDEISPTILQDTQFGELINGNPKFIYPTYFKNGRMKEKRYKCPKCPSAFEKREQYKIHLSLHGSKQKYKCEICDYSVKYYANYVQHVRKHQMSAEAITAKKTNLIDDCEEDYDDVLSDVINRPVTPPYSKLAIKTLNASSKRGPLKLSVADRQTLMILQQRRTSSASSSKDTTGEEKKLFWCPHCPYTNYRRDAVDNHLNRHIAVSGTRSNYTCDHCDYTVPQSHFLRDHIKIHFTPMKSLQPDSFMACKRIKLVSKKLGEEEESIFEDCGNKIDSKYKPPLDAEVLTAISDQEKIYVNPHTGEIIESSDKVKFDTKEQQNQDCAIIDT